ncbi:MAG TPA: helix-turn-helix transcriptional regulator [Puia sp.]|nr:helix-turn-helix transcriptional regulator [Puia sp.]
MIRYAFELTDFPRWAAGLRRLLRLSPRFQDGEAGTLPGPVAIRTGRLYPGISFVIVDLVLAEDLTISLQPSDSRSLCLLFNLGSHRPTVRLFSTGTPQEMTYPAKARMRKIGILAADPFLRRHVLKPILADLFWQANLSPGSHHEPVPFGDRAILEDILRADRLGPLYHLHLHSGLLLLAGKFLQTFVTRTGDPREDEANWPNATEKDLLALRGVMKTLRSNSVRKFPTIASLSKSAMMSSTKLKTRFKQVYGMKLYEFYNHHRLLRAKALLRTGGQSVKQIGKEVGFSNLSNFAKAFKREFGVLPHEILNSK